VENKESSLTWRLAAVAGPIGGILNIREYFKHGCVDFIEAFRSCGASALPSLIIVEMFCFSFPAIWLWRALKSHKKNKEIGQ
jgi:hypothetical protein